MFHAIFDGKKLKPKQMFSTIRFYTPSGYPREEPHLTHNVAKFNTAVRNYQLKEKAFSLHRQRLTRGKESLDQEGILQTNADSFRAKFEQVVQPDNKRIVCVNISKLPSDNLDQTTTPQKEQILLAEDDEPPVSDMERSPYFMQNREGSNSIVQHRASTVSENKSSTIQQI